MPFPGCENFWWWPGNSSRAHEHTPSHFCTKLKGVQLVADSISEVHVSSAAAAAAGVRRRSSAAVMQEQVQQELNRMQMRLEYTIITTRIRELEEELEELEAAEATEAAEQAEAQAGSGFAGGVHMHMPNIT